MLRLFYGTKKKISEKENFSYIEFREEMQDG